LSGEHATCIHLPGLAGGAPIKNADSRRGHEITFRAPRGVHALGLIAQQVEASSGSETLDVGPGHRNGDRVIHEARRRAPFGSEVASSGGE